MTSEQEVREQIEQALPPDTSPMVRELLIATMPTIIHELEAFSNGAKNNQMLLIEAVLSLTCSIATSSLSLFDEKSRQCAAITIAEEVFKSMCDAATRPPTENIEVRYRKRGPDGK